MADLNKLADMATKVGKKMVSPQSGEAKAIGEKQANIKNYMDAVSGETAALKAPPAQAGNAINKNAKFGDNAGEKRLDVSDMVKPLGSYKKGTSHVPKTGVYQLHEGEAVIPKEANPFAMVPGAQPKSDKAPKEIKEIRTRKAANGGFIHEHHHTSMDHPVEEHVSNNQDEMAGHMLQAMGTPNPGEESNG